MNWVPSKMEKYISQIIQVIVLGGTLLWTVGDLKGDIRVLQNDVSHIRYYYEQIAEKVNTLERRYK